MTSRQLAEKYDEPECMNISPFYEWLPLLLLTHYFFKPTSTKPQAEKLG